MDKKLATLLAMCGDLPTAYMLYKAGGGSGTGRASGPIATFETTKSANLKALSVAIEPVQAGSGDPSPDNVRPISGWTGVNVTRTGKNLLPPQTISSTGSGITVTTDENGAITISGTATAYKQAIANDTIKLPAGTYTLSANGTNVSGSNLQLRSTDGLTTFVTCGLGESKEFTLTADTEIKLRVTVGNGIAVNQTLNPFIEAGSATAYEPYQGDTYSVTFPSDPGTVYGGTLDVVSGVLTVTHVMVDLGALTWTANGSGDTKFFQTTAFDVKPSTTNAICSQYKYSAIATANTAQGFNINGERCRLRDAAFVDSTAAEFKTAMSGVQLCYELATPLTYNLTPTEIKTLVGTNNIWSDAGDVDVTYRR